MNPVPPAFNVRLVSAERVGDRLLRDGNMLHNLAIRTKLLAVLALPILALALIAGAESLRAFDKAQQASQVERFTAGSTTFGTLVVSLQSERSVSVAFLQKRPVAGELAKARAATDAALVSSRALIATVDLGALSPQATAVVAAADRVHADLMGLRAGVSSGRVKTTQVFDRYSAMIAGDVSLPQRIGEGLTDRTTGGQLTAYGTAAQLGELATQEREVGLAIISAGAADPLTSATLARLAALQTESVVTYRRYATTTEAKSLDVALAQPAAARSTYNELQRSMLAAGGAGRLSLDAADWRNATNNRISALSGLAAPIAAEASRDAAAASSAARTKAVLVLAGGALLVAILILLGSMLSRTITRPLRRLSEVAAQVGELLPQMVERMATPGDGPGITMPEFPVGANDEVGQLARIFRDVNTTTLRVAEEQAALRASIAEMFVNVARRNHVLLSRQLSFIDQLERSEENPDTLENLFRLDHLATRMRRNAESLIVLAGVDSGRRLRRPMPLSDVIRTAVSEIERYDRVDLALQADPPMVGHVALSAAHLLAELLENATQFSNPDTRVITSAAFTAQGVRITITDQGLGMTWDEINDANQCIADPPMSDIVGSQRLGFFVVGRLARRLDAAVELKPGRAQGTIVTIDLPRGLFVSGSVLEGIGLHNEPLEPSPSAGSDDGSADVPSRAGMRPAPAQGPVLTPARVNEKRSLHSVDTATETQVEPRASVIPEPFPDQPLPTDQAPAAVSAPGSLLPRREARESQPDVSPTALIPRTATPPTLSPPAEPTAAAPRAGIFGGFQSRRQVAPAESAVPVPLYVVPPVDDAPSTVDTATQDEPTLAAPVIAEVPMTFVPTLDEDSSTFVPLLEAPPSAAAPQSLVRRESTLATRGEGAAGQATAPTPDPLGPLDQDWPRTAPEPLLEPPPPALEPMPPTDAGLQATQPDGASWGASSALTELVHDTPASAPVEPDPPAQAARPYRSVSSMDILPTRGGGGRSLRHRRQPKHAVAEQPQQTARATTWSVPGSAPIGEPEQQGPVAPNLFGSVFDAMGAGASQEPLEGNDTGPVEPALPGFAAAQALRERSAMASQALSELSALSTYRPDAAAPTAAAGLVRRTPQATAAGQLPEPAMPLTGPRRPERNAADVRSTLSGFRAGVQRGRTSPGATQDENGASR